MKLNNHYKEEKERHSKSRINSSREPHCPLEEQTHTVQQYILPHLELEDYAGTTNDITRT